MNVCKMMLVEGKKRKGIGSGGMITLGQKEVCRGIAMLESEKCIGNGSSNSQRLSGPLWWKREGEVCSSKEGAKLEGGRVLLKKNKKKHQ